MNFKQSGDNQWKGIKAAMCPVVGAIVVWLLTERVSMCYTISLLLLAVLGVGYGFANVDTELEHPVTASNDFDVLIFVQHWPETVCFQWKEKIPSHRCLLPHLNEWTIHGIWPSQYHKMGPQFCNKTLHFNSSALSPIEDQLNEKWINIEDGTPHYSFWRHEWEKHGTCAALIEDMNTELKYFRHGLNYNSIYDMTSVLSKANITPGGHYAARDILDGILRVLGKKAQVQCIRNPQTGESYLSEIRICLSKALELMDCDGISGFPTNCDSSQPVIYPGNVPSKYHVIQV